MARSICDLFAALFGDGPHDHKCGFDKDPKRDGCGHEWRHDSADFNSEAEFQAAHFCPQCGAGPWKFHLNRYVEEKRNGNDGREIPKVA